MDEEKLKVKIEVLSQSCEQLSKLEQEKLFEEISNTVASYVRYENDYSDTTDEIFDALGEIVESVQEEFKELVGTSNHKNNFIKALTKVFTLLLNTNVDTVEKIKKILKIAIETTLKIWQ